MPMNRKCVNDVNVDGERYIGVVVDEEHGCLAHSPSLITLAI